MTKLKLGTLLIGKAKHNLGIRVVVSRVTHENVYARMEDGMREFRINPLFYSEEMD